MSILNLTVLLVPFPTNHMRSLFCDGRVARRLSSRDGSELTDQKGNFFNQYDKKKIIVRVLRPIILFAKRVKLSFESLLTGVDICKEIFG